MSVPTFLDLDGLTAAVAELLVERRRALVGLSGPPGAGKSTLAGSLVGRLTEHGHQAVVVGMDGFHLANAELDRLGRRDRKGAPDTFDARGYAALLRRLRTELDNVVYAPCFHREVEEAYAAEVPVPPDVRVVVTEGNYLLLDAEPWPVVRACLDAAYHVELRSRSVWTGSSGGTSGPGSPRSRPGRGPPAATSATPRWSRRAAPVPPESSADRERQGRVR